MVDTATTMARDHVALDGDGPVQLEAISRSGLLPHAHLEVQPARRSTSSTSTGTEQTSSDSQHACELAERAVSGVDEDWRDVIDAVHPFANALWRRFDADERRLFIERLARNWDVHRHRMAPSTARRIAALRNDDRLTVERGQVLGQSPPPWRVKLLPRSRTACTRPIPLVFTPLVAHRTEGA